MTYPEELKARGNAMLRNIGLALICLTAAVANAPMPSGSCRHSKTKTDRPGTRGSSQKGWPCSAVLPRAPA